MARMILREMLREARTTTHQIKKPLVAMVNRSRPRVGYDEHQHAKCNFSNVHRIHDDLEFQLVDAR